MHACMHTHVFQQASGARWEATVEWVPAEIHVPFLEWKFLGGKCMGEHMRVCLHGMKVIMHLNVSVLLAYFFSWWDMYAKNYINMLALGKSRTYLSKAVLFWYQDMCERAYMHILVQNKYNKAFGLFGFESATRRDHA